MGEALTLGEQYAAIGRWNAVALERGRPAVEAHEERARLVRERVNARKEEVDVR